MIKKGYTAVALHRDSRAWKDRVSDKNYVSLPLNTRTEVISVRRNKWYSLRPRAIIEGQIYTLTPNDWAFTPVRVGELRRWKDERAAPFIVISIDSHGCSCLGPDGKFEVSHRYVEEFSEVISETG